MIDSKSTPHAKVIKIDKLYKLRILIIACFCIVFCGAVASIVCWGVFIKPFEKFEHYKKELIFGNSFDSEGVNVVRMDESVSPRKYEFRYEIDGKVYVRYWKIWAHNRIGRYTEFDYLVADPNYTVGSRGLALIMLPIIFIILCLLDVVIIKLYLKERLRYKNYSYRSILGIKLDK